MYSLCPIALLVQESLQRLNISLSAEDVDGLIRSVAPPSKRVAVGPLTYRTFLRLFPAQVRCQRHAAV